MECGVVGSVVQGDGRSSKRINRCLDLDRSLIDSGGEFAEACIEAVGLLVFTVLTTYMRNLDTES